MKNWYQSKTVWLNLIAGILSFLPMVDVDLLTLLGVINITSYLTVIGLITTFLNLILRVLKNEQTTAIKFFENK